MEFLIADFFQEFLEFTYKIIVNQILFYIAAPLF